LLYFLFSVLFFNILNKDERWGRRWRKKIRGLWFIISYNKSLNDSTSSFKKNQTVENKRFNKVYGRRNSNMVTGPKK